MQAQASSEKIVQWLSPQSDHFPTPRGFHFLSAPILPDSESDISADESNSPSIISSNAWNRVSVSTDVTEFDDIYDVSEDEDDSYSNPRRNSSLKRKSSLRSKPALQVSNASPASTRALPPLVIPNTDMNSNDTLKKLVSPVPPTPPAKVEMSPAVISFMRSQQTQDIPTSSAPPSLDGSLSSDQMAAMSAPPTPVIGGSEAAPCSDWSGVQLQPAALATLQALSGGDGSERNYEEREEQVIEVPSESMPEMSQQPARMQQQQQAPRPFMSLPPLAARFSSNQRQSMNDLTRLEIPSPGGFFGGLSPRSRNTWHPPTMTPDEIAPPTSTTAEQFYRCPWNEQPAPPVPAVPAQISNLPPPPPRRPGNQMALPPPPPMPASSAPIQQIVEVRGNVSDGMPTARPIIMERIVEVPEIMSPGLPTAIRIEPEQQQQQQAPKSPAPVCEPASPTNEGGRVDATEIVTTYDSQYVKKMQQEALSNLDRTELWLMAQKAYLQGIDVNDDAKSEIESDAEDGHVPDTPALPIEEELKAPASSEPAVEEEEEEKAQTADAATDLQRKKTVRFSSVVTRTDIPRSLPSKIAGRQESAYYRAFQDYIIRSRSQDAFVHRLPRFEMLQAQRVSLQDSHRHQLLGKYQLSVVPQSAKKRMSANVARGDDVLTADDPARIKQEKEIEAFAQMATSNWAVAASKALQGGRLFSAPIAQRLARLSRLSVTASGTRARILDLGGQATCDWAWHCALAYPNAKVYTVTTKALRQLSNANVRGPPNHRQVAVPRLTKLPFPDGHFDLVAARELHSLLKFVGENGRDEWEACLAECHRVLKPGGYIEFSVLDSDVVNAGPLGLAKSVEFGFGLKTLGYDPQPTRLFLPRLSRAGFEGVRRAWTCLPLGPRPANVPPPVPAKTPQEAAKQANSHGTTDGAAGISGVAGSWAWERWLLRCEMEKVASERRLEFLSGETEEEALGDAARQGIAGVSAVLEEGRRRGAGWRCLQGFARKPLDTAVAVIDDAARS